MIELFSANTPNGKKISIMLEEINFEYKVTKVDINNEISNKAVLKPEFRKDIIHANSNVVRYLSHLLRDNTTSLNFQSQLLMFNYHFGCYQFNNQRRSLVSRVKGLML